MASHDLDETDETLLQQLQEDARTPLEELSEIVELGTKEVEQRIEALQEQGIISRFTALVNPTKLGYISVAFGVSTDPTKTDEIARKLSEIENVYKAWILSGQHNIVLHASFRDIAEFQTFCQSTFQEIEGIDQYESSIMTSSVLDEGSVVLSEKTTY